MAIQRFKALEEVLNRKPVHVELPKATVSEFYGENVFNKETMKKWLSAESYKSVLSAMEQGTKISPTITATTNTIKPLNVLPNIFFSFPINIGIPFLRLLRDKAI